MNETQIDEYLNQARELASKRIASAKKTFRLGSFARFDLNLENESIIFLDKAGRSHVCARALPIGSWSNISQSWMWSWDNKSIPAEASAPLLPVKAFGKKHGIEGLCGPVLNCDEEMAWALASVALKILDAECIYRIAQERSQLFLVLNNLRKTMVP